MIGIMDFFGGEIICYASFEIGNNYFCITLRKVMEKICIKIQMCEIIMR
jgi:hypothetical protein